MRFRKGNIVRITDPHSKYYNQLGVIIAVDPNKWIRHSSGSSILYFSPHQVLVLNEETHRAETIWIGERYLTLATKDKMPDIKNPGWTKIPWSQCIWKPKEAT
jgi:hypothetical protein